MISGIGEPPSTIVDRAVPIDLKRKLPGEAVKPLREKDGPDLAILKRKIARFVADNEEALRRIEPTPLAVDNDRAKDMWDALLAVSDVAGGAWPGRARAAGKALVAAKADPTDRLELLLGDIRGLFDEEADGRPPEGGDHISSTELAVRLAEIEGRPWAEYGRSMKPITKNALARLLRKLGIAPQLSRFEGTMARGYHRGQFEEAWGRYLSTAPTEGAPTVATVTNPGKPGEAGLFATVTNPSSVTVANSSETPGTPPFVTVATVASGGRGGSAESDGGGKRSTSHPSALPLDQLIIASEGAGLECILDEPGPGFTWIYALGVDPNEPDVRLVERELNQRRGAVEAFLRRRANREAYEVLSPAGAGQRCGLCGSGKPRPLRIRRNGEVNVWHPGCADRYVATLVASPPAPEQDGSGEGPQKGGG